MVYVQDCTRHAHSANPWQVRLTQRCLLASVSAAVQSIRSYFSADDDFNWNYGLALAATGKYKEGEEALAAVQREAYRSVRDRPACCGTQLVFGAVCSAYLQSPWPSVLSWGRLGKCYAKVRCAL